MGKGKGISRRIPYWLMFAVLAVGGSLVDELASDYYQYFWYVRLGQKNLQDVELLLRRYKADHGQYPTTDEGLAVLDGYASRFGFKRSHFMLLFGPVHFMDKPWPTNEDEFRAAYTRNFDNQDGNLPGVEIGIRDSGYAHVLYQKEPLDLTGIPYCYEDRQGGTVSLIPADQFGMFSRKIDEYVRLSSPGLHRIWARMAPLRKRLVIALLVFGACVVVLASWWVYDWLRDSRNGDPSARFSVKRALLSLLWLILAFGIVWCLKPTYGTGGISMNPAIAGKYYLAIQSDMLSAGVISKETYDRRISAASLALDMAAARTKRSQQGGQEVPTATAPSTSAPASRPADANDTARP